MILPNQAVAFGKEYSGAIQSCCLRSGFSFCFLTGCLSCVHTGTESYGFNRGGTSARVMYEIQDGRTNERIAACQMRWVNPLAQGKLKVWCETRTNFSGGQGPKIERHVPNSKIHSAVTFEIHWAACAEDHFNPDIQSNPGGMLPNVSVKDFNAGPMRGSSLQHQVGPSRPM